MEREIRDTVTKLWREVEWGWYRQRPDSDVLYWHWSPDYGFHINHPLIGWNETMIVYLLAIASPTHPRAGGALPHGLGRARPKITCVIANNGVARRPAVTT